MSETRASETRTSETRTSEKRSAANPGSEPYDPFGPWRTLRDASMDAWSKALIEYVNSDAYSKTTGAMLESYLTASAPFRELLDKTMTRSLAQFNMPTREEILSLAQRLTNIEMRLDDLDAKLDKIQPIQTEMSRARDKRETK